VSHKEAQKAQKQSNVRRIFCAVELPQRVRERLQDHIQRLRNDVSDVAASWSRVENIWQRRVEQTPGDIRSGVADG
jgi:hypothetical protein